VDRASRFVRVATALAICAIGGAVCAALHMPLPWMIGSMLAMASVQMAGAELEPLPGGRDVGMVVVGATLGLYFTAPVVHEISAYWPWFVALGFAAIAFGTLSAFVLARLARVDRATAFFGSMPGGAADMALMGERHGAVPALVALSHSIRMLFVVTLFPIGITLAGFSATEEYRPVLVAFDPMGLAALLALGAVSGAIARRIGLPTAFMMGSLLATIAITVAGIELSSVPTPLVNVAQVLLGCNLGARFERSFLASAPRFVMAVIASVAITMGAAALVGWGLAAGSGAYLGSGLLAAAPGGIAEMSITAKVLRIGVAFVTAAHVVRYLIVVLLTVPVFRLIDRHRTRDES
jgi:membrane AbrB-like protein